MSVFSRSAVLEWTGGFPRGNGNIAADSGAFAVSASYPMISGDPPGATTPEELLAAAHAACFGIGLRSQLRVHGATAKRVIVRATITAEKGQGGIRIQSSHLEGLVEGLEGIDQSQLQQLARATDAGCTVSNAMRASVAITYVVAAVGAGAGPVESAGPRVES